MKIKKVYCIEHLENFIECYRLRKRQFILLHNYCGVEIEVCIGVVVTINNDFELKK